MGCFLLQENIIIGNAGGADAFWSQILVLVVLAVIVGIGSFIKTRADRLKEYRQYDTEEDAHGRQSWFRQGIEAVKRIESKYVGTLFNFAWAKKIAEKPAMAFAGRHRRESKLVDEQAQRDLDSGMEVLGVGFLVGIIEKTDEIDEDDVVMRKLSFNELVRRGRLGAVDSNVLRAYAINQDDLYGKEVQCEAMKELALRPGHESDYGFKIKEISRSSGVHKHSQVSCS